MAETLFEKVRFLMETVDMLIDIDELRPQIQKEGTDQVNLMNAPEHVKKRILENMDFTSEESIRISLYVTMFAYAGVKHKLDMHAYMNSIAQAANYFYSRQELEEEGLMEPLIKEDDPLDGFRS